MTTDERAGKAWAYRILERYLNGERLLKIQIDFAREAIPDAWPKDEK